MAEGDRTLGCVKVGVMLPIGDTDGPGGAAPAWRDIVAIGCAAEAEGLDSVWLADHLLYRSPEGKEYGIHEAWTVLAGIAAVTERVELGTLVLCTSFRNPGLVAKMAAAVDVVSAGRLILGLGCGWHDPEYDAFGYPTDHRVGRFAEAIEIIGRLLQGERVTLAGEFHEVNDAALLPPPARPIPLLVAAKGPRMLGLTAKWASSWNTAWYGLPDERLSQRLSDFEAGVRAAGRDPADIVRTVGISVRDPEQPATPEPESNAIAGDIDALAAALDAYAALGIGHLMVGLEPISVRSVERLAEAVRRHREPGGDS
jgi:alkanesulfonate monooxygenase SsuD/methylene tetrahydromethanopterin reductase-like flavin-dependent oxidoreductase (luciferase family)